MLAFWFLKSKYSTLFLGSYTGKWASQVAQWVKNLPAVQETQADVMPGLGRSPGGGHGDPLQDACLENPMDRGTWWAPVHRVTKTRRKRLSMHASKQAVQGAALLGKEVLSPYTSRWHCSLIVEPTGEPRQLLK